MTYIAQAISGNDRRDTLLPIPIKKSTQIKMNETMLQSKKMFINNCVVVPI